MFVVVYETETINNRLVRMLHEFRFRSTTVVFHTQETQDENKHVYMPHCADLRPRPLSRYVILVEKIGDADGYVMSTLKLGVCLNWYLHGARHETDLILETVQATPPLTTDVVVTSAQ